MWTATGNGASWRFLPEQSQLDAILAGRPLCLPRSFQVNSASAFPYTLTSLPAPQPLMDQIEIRHCATIPEYEECVRIEHVTWGEGISVPSAIFVVAHHTGGQVIAAFDREKMIG